MIESLVERIELDNPSLLEITTGASLAHHGLLGSVEEMWLDYKDLSSVPAEHLASLAACVKWRVFIRTVSNTDLTSFLDSCKSKVLLIQNQSLCTEETRAVVRAMANVEKVALEFRGEVTLDISTLVTYGGRGNCKEVVFGNNTAWAANYREEVRRWAQRISWKVTCDNSNVIIIRGFMN